MFGAFKQVTRIWNATDGKPLPDPANIKKGTRATFVCPNWASLGWAPDSPGFVWWFSAQHAEAPRCLIGEKMLETLRADPANISSARATTVHAFAHRYPVEKETMRDLQTWHTGILLEWSHGLYVTLIELAWLNGCGGYGGKSNWCEDKLASKTMISLAMADTMVCPWDMTRAEIRVIDMPLRSKDEFLAYLLKYSNHDGLDLKHQRFVDPEIYKSGPVRLRNCTPVDLAGYMLNFVSRASAYVELTANCQTFTADMYAFLAGASGSVPYGALIRAQYQQRSKSFLYLP